MNKITLLGALALSLMSPLAMAEKPLRIGIEAAYPPFAFKTPDGQISGFDYDIGNAPVSYTHLTLPTNREV